MMRSSLTGLTINRLRLWLTIFFLALAIPALVLIYKAYSQLKWETFHQYQTLAEELNFRIDQEFNQLLAEEEARSFTDYSFLNVIGDPKANALQRSPLSGYPVSSRIPGVIGYFQIDSSGALSTPLLPEQMSQALSFGVTSAELNQRQAIQNNIQQILSENKLVEKKNILARKRKLKPGLLSELEKSEQLREEKPKQKTAESAEAQSPRFSFSSPAPEPVMDMDMDSAAGKGSGNETEGEADMEVASQSAFDNLNMAPAEESATTKKQLRQSLGRVEDLKLKSGFAAQRKETAEKSKRRDAPEKRSKRIERSVLPEQKLELKDDVSQFARSQDESVTANQVPAASSDYRIRIFESEIDAFEASLLDSGHFVLFRKVWRDEQRFIQGILIDSEALFRGIVENAFWDTALSQMSSLAIAYRGNVVSAFSGENAHRYIASAEELQGALLYRSRLSSPFSQLELIYSIQRLPLGAGATVINWVAGILMLVLCGGFYLMYRLGVGQINLTRQQQDFVSAVSHELKTPLTSIRMYGEILREGWADDEKKTGYYNYIYDESERLSRLINNVLQLARMTRNELQIEFKLVTVSELMDTVKSKVSSQVERAGFELGIQCDDAISETKLNVDMDYFSQVIINLVDNALKFSSKAETRKIDIQCRKYRDNVIQFSIRDYGPGIPKDQLKKIFKLFYRSENELTRETVGTGIGLALVRQLTSAMHGEIDVINQSPGAEFRVNFPVSNGA